VIVDHLIKSSIVRHSIVPIGGCVAEDAPATRVVRRPDREYLTYLNFKASTFLSSIFNPSSIHHEHQHIQHSILPISPLTSCNKRMHIPSSSPIPSHSYNLTHSTMPSIRSHQSPPRARRPTPRLNRPHGFRTALAGLQIPASNSATQPSIPSSPPLDRPALAVALHGIQNASKYTCY
jgi:hypothetical protein